MELEGILAWNEEETPGIPTTSDPEEATQSNRKFDGGMKLINVSLGWVKLI